MNYLENCQSRYRSNPWMGGTCTDGSDELEPSKFDCMTSIFIWSGKGKQKLFKVGVNKALDKLLPVLNITSA